MGPLLFFCRSSWDTEWDPDWDADNCSWFSEGCCPHGYDPNDIYATHHHHYTHLALTPRPPTPAGWSPDFLPWVDQS